MIKFRQKNYTIPEGHYTGPKDMEDIPGAVEMMAKGGGIGAGVGAVAGRLLKDQTTLGGAWEGFKAGTIGGIIAKLFINYLHKPMKTVKYQEVDKSIRRQFGIYQVSGVTVGDSLKKRTTVEEKFAFNDRNVSNYKLTFAIHDNQVTMYTFGMTKEELDKTSKSLDYYCKKYFSMEYSAKVINLKVNSYAVDITFTNYQALCQFILELSETLGCKINLMDNDVIIKPRLEEASEGDQKEFSVSALSKYDTIKLIGSGIVKAIPVLGKPSKALCNFVLSVVGDSVAKVGTRELEGVGVKMGDLQNQFLQDELTKLHYIEGYHYSVGDEPAEVAMSLVSGVFIVTTTEPKDVEKAIGSFCKKSTSGKVTIFTHPVVKVGVFETLLRKLMTCGKKPNLFDKGFGTKMFSNAMLGKIEDQLKREGEEDFEISSRVPNDVVSVTSDLAKVKIYIPEESEYSQYEIDDYIREEFKYVRTTPIFERNILTLKLLSPLTQPQFIKLVKFIIASQGFCTIIG